MLEVLLPVSTAEAVLDFAQAVLTKHGVLEIANRSATWNLDKRDIEDYTSYPALLIVTCL